MGRFFIKINLLTLLIMMSYPAALGHSQPVWENLPELPRPLAGQCVGTSGNLLLVAGGSFWKGEPWNGGGKYFVRTIYALAPGWTEWRLAGKLPGEIAYSASATRNGALFCIGGQDATGAKPSVVQLKWDGKALHVTRMLDLPVPLVNAQAAAFAGRIFLVGGQTRLSGPSVSSVWSWKPGEMEWKAEQPVPASSRILPVVAACSGNLWVASGAHLMERAGPNGEKEMHREYLKDVWTLSRNTSWQRQTSLPRALVAAPSVCARDGLHIFGGDDGMLADQILELKQRHPGFQRKALLIRADGSQISAPASIDLPMSLVTTGAVSWNGGVAIPGGEDRAGHRSARVLFLSGSIGTGKSAP